MDGFREGDSRTLQIAITDDIVNAFAEWSGDDAPLHTSDAYARARGFEKKVVHGAALFSLVSRFVGVGQGITKYFVSPVCAPTPLYHLFNQLFKSF